jgi:hypothetical protein
MRSYSSSVEGLLSRQLDSLTGVNTSSMYPSETIIVPDTESDFTVISLGDAKSILPVHDNNSDSYITTLIRGTQEQVGRYIKLDLTRRQRTSYWYNPSNKLKLSFGIHGAVSNVKVADRFGTETTLVLNENYYVSGNSFKEIYLTSIPVSFDSVSVTYWSGYEEGYCPDAIRLACVQELNFQYKNRQDINQGTTAIINGLTLESKMLLETYIRRI